MRGRTTVKGTTQSPVFEGVYNNTRMLHFLTAVVGSTCDVRVRNGTVYEGIFKTLSSKLELAVDTVHRKSGDSTPGPKSDDIIDTMIFKPSDVVVVQFRDVDLNYAMRDKLTDSMVNAKVNGEHRENSLQPWEGGVDSNCDDFDLESDVSNGWDANEMFRFNEETYGVKTTYDSSLSSYTTPLEKDNSAEFRQREQRATQLAKEIEASPQYRVRVSLENDDGRSEEERFSAVQRPPAERDGPSANTREGKYIPLPQRSREGSVRVGGLRAGVSRGGRMGSLPPRTSPHHPDPCTSPADQRIINGGPSRMSPKAQRPTRGGKPQAGRGNPSPDVAPHPQPSGLNRSYHPRSPKSAVSLPPPSPPSSPPNTDNMAPISTPPPGSVSPKAPAPAFTIEVKDLGGATVKEVPRAADATTSGSQELNKAVSKALVQSPSDHKRNQIEELRRFGEDFRLQDVGGRVKEGVEETVAGDRPSAPDPSDHPDPAGLESAERREDKKLPDDNEGPAAPASPPGKGEDEEDGKEGVSEQVKKSTLNPHAKEFNPTKALVPLTKPASTPTPPRPQAQPSPSMLVSPTQAIYNTQYISYVHGIHVNPAVQGPQVYQYAIPPVQVSQAKQFRNPKGSGQAPRSEQHHPPSAPPILQAASAAGPPLVAGPYSPPYLPYGPQQYTGQPTMMQAMAQYHTQPVYASMIQGNPRMMAAAAHQPTIVSSSAQYPPTDQAPPQAMYVSAGMPQPYPHGAPLHHHPQPPSTPTGSQQQGPHAPSPVQHQAAQQPQQSLYHTAMASTPPSINPTPNPQSPQSSYPQQAVYTLHPHQQIPHPFTSMAHMAQAHVQAGLPGSHHHPGAGHHPQVMLLPAPQGHGHGPPGQQPTQHNAGVNPINANAPTHYTYIGHHQVPVPTHQQPLYHPQGN